MYKDVNPFSSKTKMHIISRRPVFSFTCFVSSLICAICYAEGKNTMQPGISDFLTEKRLLELLEKSLLYMAKYARNLDVDALLGVALAQGHLLNMDQSNMKVKKCLLITNYLIKYGKRIYFHRNSLDVSKLIFSPDIWMSVTSFDTKDLYCRSYSKMPEKLLTHRIINSPNETQSDLCLSELLRFQAEKRPGSIANSQCNISQQCQDAMTIRNSWGYALLHGILFDLISVSTGCQSINNIEDSCCKVLQEINILEEHNIPLETADLFLEDVLMCSVAGFRTFLKYNWFQTMFTWKNPVGCWWDFVTKKPMYGRRVGRSTTLFERDNCSTHTTGLAVALLATGARHYNLIH